MKPKHMLTELFIDEVAFVDQGANPEADIVLFKRHGEDDEETSRFEQLYDVWKQDADDPRDFDEVREDRMAGAVGDALWTRLDTLMSAYWGILYSDADDKAARIVESTDQFRESLLQDIDGLMSGAIAKHMNAPHSGDDKGGGIMPLDLEKLPEELREQAKAQNEFVSKIRKGLKLDDDVSDEDVLKAFAEKVGVDEVIVTEPIDKSKLPESVVKLLEKQDAENTELRESVTKLTGEVTTLKDDAERREMRKVAETLVGDTDELTETLIKAKKAGVYDNVLKSLRAASEQTQSADELLKTFGHQHDTTVADDSALGELTKRVKKVREEKPDLSEYQAMEAVFRADPQLQAQYLAEQQGQRH